jgi:erythromycin esterase
MEAMADPDRTESLSEAEVEAISQELQQIGTALNQCDQADPDVINMKKVVENMETAREYYQLEFPDSYTYRDTAMAANVTWILNREKELGSGKLLIAGHDGHIAKCTSSAIIPVVMGGVLKEQYGDAYYSLGTDAFKGKANIHVETSAEYTRKDYFFHSADPMAYQAKYMEDKHYFMDFTTLSESDHPEVYEQVHSKMNMASLGEGFSAMYYLLPYVYRIHMTPTDLYDGMIFYYEVQATNPEY